ncbi:flagellar hook capping protein [Kineobactrum sediminis]|uniref:Basal-body rod modification protein FlgD n=1 Tax=Kineobactrum sediminis TaxID=1905677 RepID=A0A2N5Y6I5_9GAMM|nr:flagellar hook assembly protein FlgD [Kineobactrum sediminis]PLW83992.1 flagellar hook capping protein [Kineobactrum sediminis]
MNDVSAIQSMLGVSTPKPEARGTGSDMGQEDFLRLMMEQLSNQDPFKPMENGDFLGQIAQFSTVSGIGELQASFESTASALTGNQALQASAVVDRDVLVPASNVRFDGQTAVAGAMDIPAGATAAMLAVTDARGQLVAQLPVALDAGGRATFSWDGRDSEGNMAPAGDYQLATGYQLNGKAEAAQPLVWGRVDSVTLSGPGGGISVNVSGIGAMSLSRALEIS